MTCYIDKKSNTWISQFYYTDLNGIRRREIKNGFPGKEDAQRYEREFKKTHDKKNLTFEFYAKIYLDDARYRIRTSSFKQKQYIFETKILPFFKDKVMTKIKPRDIRSWQSLLLAHGQENGKPYSRTYLRTLYNQLNAVFNFAVRFYDLKENPCLKAGNFGPEVVEEKKIWTIEDYYKFQDLVYEANPYHSLAIEVLYFTGMRIGELLALSPRDVDPIENTISINKTFMKLDGEDYISAPKTRKSTRKIAIPPSLSYKLLTFMKKDKERIQLSDRLFTFTPSGLAHTIKKYSPLAQVPVIRIHDLRHSHVSLLINLGFDVNVIADRLGHEKIETTLGIYTHLYPKVRKEVSEKLEQFYQPALSDPNFNIQDKDYVKKIFLI